MSVIGNLKSVTETTHVVKVKELEDFILTVFGQSYDIIKNESISYVNPLTFTLKKGYHSPLSRTTLDRWIDTPEQKQTYALPYIMQSLVNLGHIDAGNYKIIIN